MHFVGIGGAALSGLARIMVARGVTVTGSDAKDSVLLDALRGLGVTCWIGHDAAHVDDADTVVVSTAVKEDNPEVVRAGERGLRLWPRSAAVQSVHARADSRGRDRHARQDDDDLDAGHRPDRLRRRPVVRDRVDPQRVGSQRGGRGRVACSSPRATRATARSWPTRRPRRSSPTSTATTSTTTGRSRPTPRSSTSSSTRIEPGGFLVCCADDPGAARLADVAARIGVDVVRVGLGEDCDLRATRGRVRR